MTNGTIYLDEAGNVGLGAKASKFFVIGFVFIIDRESSYRTKEIKKLLNRINSNINQQQNKISEFKFSSDHRITIERFLRKILRLGLDLGVMEIDKSLIRKETNKDGMMFYMSSVAQSIMPVIDRYLQIGDPDNKLTVMIDKLLTNKKHRDVLDEYLKEAILSKTHGTYPAMNMDITIIHGDSRRVPMLQVADYVAGATYRRITRHDPTFYDMISSMVRYRVAGSKL